MQGTSRRRGLGGIAEVDLPREKLERLGPEALRDEELLAVLLRTGYEGTHVLRVARTILGEHVLSFTAPWPLFLEMEGNVEGSFLDRMTWRSLRKPRN